MILTKELLINWGACSEGIDFCETHNLFGFDLNRINEIQGDYNGFIRWIKQQIKMKWIYNSEGKCIRCESKFDYWVNYQYDSQGNKIKEENSDGDWVKWEYDQHGNIIKEENSNDYWTKWEYDQHGNIIKEEDSDGIWFKYYYNDQGRCIKEEYSNNSWITNTYDDLGHILTTKLSDGGNIVYQYDSKFKLIKKISTAPSWYKIYEYDNNENVIKEEDSNKNGVRYEYNENNNLIKITYYNAGNCVYSKKREYYPNGQLKRINNLELPLI